MLLHLHGAMVVESYEDGEGELLARLRQVLGPDVPVVVTLDLHANVTQAMADNASALIAFRTYPHIDMYERAWQGAELLERAMQGEVRPRTVIARRPMLYGLDWGRTQQGPMAELIARGEALEQSGEALAVSICAGFPLADIRDVGPSVTVTVDGDDDPARPGDRRGIHGSRLGDARLSRSHDAVGRRGGRPRAARASPATSRWSSPTTPTIPAAAAMATRRRF